MTMWTVEFYEDAGGKRPVETWMAGLSTAEYAAVRAAIVHVLEPQGLALASTPWITPLGSGLYEFRIRHDAATIESMYRGSGTSRSRAPGKILLRLFVHFHGNKIVLMLHGYDKGKDNSPTRQNKEIQRAQKMLRTWKVDQARNAKRKR